MRRSAALFLIVAACAPAQSEESLPGRMADSATEAMPEPGSPVDPATECVTVEQILAPAHPEPVAARFLKRVHACPELAGKAIADALDTLRIERDTAAIARVADLVRYVHDEHIYTASADIASDVDATIEARVFAFRSLTWSKAPGHTLGYGSMLLTPTEATCLRPGSLGPCTSSATSHFYRGYVQGDLRWPALGRPLPESFVVEIEGVCRAVGDNADEPIAVRRAARHACAWDPDPELLDLVAERR